MSGGSFEYLCYWEIEAHGALLDMAMALADDSPERDETEDIWTAIQDLNDRILKMRDVWHAVEWEQSGDYGQDQVRSAIERYRSTLGLCVSPAHVQFSSEAKP